jgi:YHS domain-containing protein
MALPRDPVCEMEINESDAAATTQYADDTYYFCAEECKEKFDADPERYVSRDETSQT